MDLESAREQLKLDTDPGMRAIRLNRILSLGGRLSENEMEELEASRRPNAQKQAS